MTQRFEGRNLDEALTSAAQELGVDRFQLTYHVLLEKRGFLGGVKRIVIEAEVNTTAPEQVVAQATAPAAPAERSGPPRSERGGRGRGGEGRRDGRRGGGRGGRREGGSGDRGGRGGQRGRGRGGDELRSGDFEQFAFEIPEQGEESETAQSVRGWLAKAIELARLELEIRTEENDTQVLVRLYGRDSRRLIDHHGELLDALQVLANKSLTGRKIEKDIELDSLEFKEQRSEDLSRRAHELAERVRRDGREQLLPAMSPIERRIVHLTLQDDEEVTTESRGDGFYKRVAVILKPAASEVSQES